MSKLVVMLSSGKGTWGAVSKLINQEEWSHVYLITTEFGKEKFTCEKEHTFVLINSFGTVEEIKKQIVEGLKGKIQLDVGVNFVSGTGNEHMALVGALLDLGVGIRLVVAGESKFEEV